MSSTLNLSDTYDTAVDTLRDVGDRLTRDLPSNLVPSNLVPSNLVPQNLPSADDMFERVAKESRRIEKRQLLMAGGAIALVLAVVWVIRRRRSDDTDGLRVADGATAA